MKKIMTLLSVMVLSTATSFAFISETQNSDLNALRAQGYSESTIRIMDTIKAKNQGLAGNYKREYTLPKESPYTRVKLYFDLAQDDDRFGEHQINYTNSWNDDDTHYSTRKIKNENL